MISQMTPAGYIPAMRARSTEASVCPARTSTPPRFARSGKMWPGRARSAGRVAGSMAARIVVARSDALMPVVVPRRASMDSVNAVPSAEVLIGDIGGRCSSSQRSSVSARQIRPRPYLAMKLICSGRDLLRDKGQIAFVFAVLVIHQNDLAALAKLLDGFFYGGKFNRHDAHLNAPDITSS